MNEAVSIVIPAYTTSSKGRNDLVCLTSKIAKQLREESLTRYWALTIIDDGSPWSVSRVDWLDKDVVCVPTKHGGVARARNIGILISRWAGYVVFVDADDNVPEDFIKILKNRVDYEAKRTDSRPDIIQFNARYEDGSVGYPEPCAWGKLISTEWIGDDRFDEDQLIGEEDTLFHKDGKTSVVEHDERILYLHRQSANPDSLMKRYWRGEIPRRRGGECYKPEADKHALRKILRNYSYQLGHRLQHGESVTSQDLNCIGDDLKTISAIEFAIKDAKEVPRGKE